MHAHHLMHLLKREVMSPPSVPHTIYTLLIVLLVLLLLTLIMIASLLFMRQRRRASKSELLPSYHEKNLSTSSISSSHHRRSRTVMVKPSDSIYVRNEKSSLIDNSRPSTPPSPVPEIRITFPEEFDALGNRQSSKVVVVRISDSGVALEPVPADEKPPTYFNRDRFQSVDLEKIGGLVEQ